MGIPNKFIMYSFIAMTFFAGGRLSQQLMQELNFHTNGYLVDVPKGEPTYWACRATPSTLKVLVDCVDLRGFMTAPGTGSSTTETESL